MRDAPRRAGLWALLLLLAAPLPVPAESVDEVIEKHLAAKGGREAWRAVRTLVLEGSYTSFSEIAPFALYRRRPDLYRFDHLLGSKAVRVVVDDELAWWINPWYEIDWAHPMPEVDALHARRDARFESPLFDYREKGHRAELAGVGSLEGSPAIELTLTLAEGGTETWFLDPQTYLEMARHDTTADFGREVERWTWFADFREVEGLVLPFRVESEFDIRHRVMEIESVRVNPDLDENLFAFPAPAGMAPLQGLAGEWEVTAASRPKPEAEWLERPASASISRRARGGLLVETLRYSAGDGTSVVLYRQWSHDRFRDLYRVTQHNDFTSHLGVYEGRFDEGRLVVDNLSTDSADASRGAERHERLTLGEISEQGFTLDLEISRDGGETWAHLRRFTYRRKGD